MSRHSMRAILINGLAVALVLVVVGPVTSYASTATFSMPAGSPQSACVQLQTLMLQAVTQQGLAGKVREVQGLCNAEKAAAKEKAKPRPWVEPCDPRSEVPAGYVLQYIRGRSYEPMTSEQQAVQCAAATKERCTWQHTDTAHFQGWAESPDPVERKPFVSLIIDLICPNGVEVYELDGVVMTRTHKLISEEEWARRNSGGDMQQRAIEASFLLKLPQPRPRMVWLWTKDSRPYTLVNGHTWFATAPQVFTNRSARATAGGTWVQVSAVPSGLAFSANGERESWCYGPGVDTYDQSRMQQLRARGIDPINRKPPGECSHRFARTSPGDPDQPVPGMMRIRWEIYWAGSGNTSGRLDDMFTQAPVDPFIITEMQTLVTK